MMTLIMMTLIYPTKSYNPYFVCDHRRDYYRAHPAAAISLFSIEVFSNNTNDCYRLKKNSLFKILYELA